MATDKRSRQRANRAQKQAQEAKTARRAVTLKRVRRIVIYGIIIAGVLLLANQVFGGGGDDQSFGLLIGS
jgi:hypothetical protein